MDVQTKHSLTHLQDLMPTLACVLHVYFMQAKVDVLENVLFNLATCDWVITVESTGWYIARYFLLLVQAGYLFPYFLLQSISFLSYFFQVKVFSIIKYWSKKYFHF